MKLRLTSYLASFALAIAFAGAASAAEPATLKIKFVWDADALPKPVEINMAKDPLCANAHPKGAIDDKLIVNPTNKGIKNVVILPDRKSNITVDDIPPAVMAKAKGKVVLDNVKCVFEPHILTTVPGGTVTVKNSDVAGHNASFSFFKNPAANQMVPPNGSVDVPVALAEVAPIPISCSIHPWMVAHVIIAETPNVGVSNENGELVVENLPAGKAIQLKVWHESQDKAIAKVNLDGKDVEWKKGVIELNLKAGENDLGVCKLTPAHFKK